MGSPVVRMSGAAPLKGLRSSFRSRNGPLKAAEALTTRTSTAEAGRVRPFADANAPAIRTVGAGQDFAGIDGKGPRFDFIGAGGNRQGRPGLYFGQVRDGFGADTLEQSARIQRIRQAPFQSGIYSGTVQLRFTQRVTADDDLQGWLAIFEELFLPVDADRRGANLVIVADRAPFVRGRGIGQVNRGKQRAGVGGIGGEAHIPEKEACFPARYCNHDPDGFNEVRLTARAVGGRFGVGVGGKDEIREGNRHCFPALEIHGNRSGGEGPREDAILAGRQEANLHFRAGLIPVDADAEGICALRRSGKRLIDQSPYRLRGEDRRGRRQGQRGEARQPGNPHLSGRGEA